MQQVSNKNDIKYLFYKVLKFSKHWSIVKRRSDGFKIYADLRFLANRYLMTGYKAIMIPTTINISNIDRYGSNWVVGDSSEIDIAVLEKTLATMAINDIRIPEITYLKLSWEFTSWLPPIEVSKADAVLIRYFLCQDIFIL